MIPSFVALPSAGKGQQSTSNLAADRAPRPDAPPRTDTKSKTETARAVEPAQAANLMSSTAPAERRNLNPPDPKAPAGPPPAFEASILDRQREEALKPPQPDFSEVSVMHSDAPPTSEQGASFSSAADQSGTFAIKEEALAVPDSEGLGDIRKSLGDTPNGAAGDDPAGEGRDVESRRAAYDVPPSAEARAEQEVATIRRLETPYDVATVDVSR